MPDATTLRKLINDNGLGERYFELCRVFLEKHGRMMHGVAAVDATIINASSLHEERGGQA